MAKGHVLLSIEQAFCIRWYINRHCFSSRHPSMYIKSWHGSKCHFLSSFGYCKEYQTLGTFLFPPYRVPFLWRLLLLLQLIIFGFTALSLVFALSYLQRLPQALFFHAMLCYALHLPLFLSDPTCAGGVGSQCWQDKEAWACFYCLHSIHYSTMLVQLVKCAMGS